MSARLLKTYSRRTSAKHKLDSLDNDERESGERSKKSRTSQTVEDRLEEIVDDISVTPAKMTDLSSASGDSYNAGHLQARTDDTVDTTVPHYIPTSLSSMTSATPPGRRQQSTTYLSRTPPVSIGAGISNRHSSGTRSLSPRAHISRVPTEIYESLPESPQCTSTTPKKPPKDLSGIFNLFSPKSSLVRDNSPSRVSGGSIASRMLSRSRAESSLGSVSTSGSFKTSSGSFKTSSNSRSGIDLGNNSSPNEPIEVMSHSPKSSSSSRIAAKTSDALSQHPRVLVATNARTYAGKSRSFLVALPAASFLASQSSSNVALKVNDPSGDDDGLFRDSYSDLRIRWGLDHSEEELQQPDPGGSCCSTTSVNHGLYNPLSSITELRSKGESRRFLDEVGYLFEGLSPRGTLNVRRSSAMEIVIKMCDADFMRKAKAADFFGRAWKLLRMSGAGEGDKVLDPVICLFSVIIADDPRDFADMAREEDFISTLFKLFALEEGFDSLAMISGGDDVALKNAGIGKAEKSMLTRLRHIILNELGLVREPTRLSSRLLLSRALCTIPSFSYPYLCTMLSALLEDFSRIPARISAYSSGLTVYPQSATAHQEVVETFSLESIANCLKVFDAFLIDNHNEEMQYHENISIISRIREPLSAGLIALITIADIIQFVDDSPERRSFGEPIFHARMRSLSRLTSSTIAQLCSENALRILINLTNDAADWCHSVLEIPLSLLTIIRLIVISHRERMSAHVKMEDPTYARLDVYAQVLDQLCLTLGLLTNLIQEVPETASLLRKTSLVPYPSADIICIQNNISLAFNPACTNKRACLPACCCTHRVNAIDCLVLVYMAESKAGDHQDDTVSHFLRGHLAILFGLLMSQDRSSQDFILAQLPGTSRRRKMDVLIKNVSEFQTSHADLAHRLRYGSHQDLHHEEDRQGGHRSLTCASQVDGVSHVSNSDTKHATAADVLKLLESLRSSILD